MIPEGLQAHHGDKNREDCNSENCVVTPRDNKARMTHKVSDSSDFSMVKKNRVGSI